MRSAIAVGVTLAAVDQVFKSTINPTVANYGMFLGIQLSPLLLVGLHIATLTVFGVLLARGKLSGVSRWWLVLLLTVSVSNLWDRLRLGYVVDYLQFSTIWFNLADAIITLGVWMILVKYLKYEYTSRSKSK